MIVDPGWTRIELPKDEVDALVMRNSIAVAQAMYATGNWPLSEILEAAGLPPAFELPEEGLNDSMD